MSRPDVVTNPSTVGLRPARVAIVGLSAVFLVEMLDNSLLNVALPTIGRDLHASTTQLQWVTGVYAVVFGGLMLLFAMIADRFGRRTVMLVGLTLLAVAGAATALVATPAELIAVRAAMGVAAAMTTPGSLALAFRLFDDDARRVRVTTIISTAGLIGLAVGPTIGGLVLAVAPWQVLLLTNVPIAVLAAVAIRRGIDADTADSLHRDPLDVPGALLGTVTIVVALLAPTLFVERGAGSPLPWMFAVAALAAAVLFVLRERMMAHPLLDLALLARPLVSSGLAYKAATGLATAGLVYLVTLQLQVDLGWTPVQAALGLLPQVAVLLAGGALVGPFVTRVGLAVAAWSSATAVVLGLAVYGALGIHGYVWIALALMLVAAGIRVNGVVAGMNVMRGLPPNRTTIGAALVDTSSEVASATGIAVAGTILAAVFSGSIAVSHLDARQADEFERAITTSGLVLAVIAAALVSWGYFRARHSASSD